MTHARIDAATLSGRRAYQLLIDTIVPRPIAWVTTMSPDGVPNLAPFSFFTGVTARPPTLALSIAQRTERAPDGRRALHDKHTVANLRASGELIVHIPSRRHRDQVVASGEALPADPQELVALGFSDIQPGTWVDVPRLGEAAVAMECRVEQIVPVGEPPVSLVLARVLGWHVREDLLVDGRIPAAGIDPLARLGVDGYQE